MVLRGPDPGPEVGSALLHARELFRSGTGNQLLILDRAAQRSDGVVLPLPEEVDLKGRVRAIVLKSLLDRGLIEPIPGDLKPTSGHPARNFRITPMG